MKENNDLHFESTEVVLRITATNGGSGSGTKGDDGDSAYEVAVKNGFVGTEQEWLASLEGPQGEKGEPGRDGTNGINGTNGADGKDGADGDSAYEVAVKNGFVGTEQEWLASLEGAQGEKGEPGEPGRDGVNGTNGKDGAQGIQGEPGKDGTNGTNGINGADGDSAYEVAVKNGFVGTEEEWLASLVGPQGEKGDPGEPGKNGINGINGVDGTSATIGIGTVTTLPAGSQATVQNVGTASAAVFDFGIPKGDKGGEGSGSGGDSLATDEEYTEGIITNKAPTVKQVKDDLLSLKVLMDSPLSTITPLNLDRITVNGTYPLSDDVNNYDMVMIKLINLFIANRNTPEVLKILDKYTLVPALTQNIGSSYIVSANQEASPTESAFNIFKLDNTWWRNGVGFGESGWIQIENVETIFHTNMFTIYIIEEADYSQAISYLPKSLEIQGSNNGTEWVTLVTDTAEWKLLDKSRSYILNDYVDYKYIRIFFVGPQGDQHNRVGIKNFLIQDTNKHVYTQVNTLVTLDYEIYSPLYGEFRFVDNTVVVDIEGGVASLDGVFGLLYNKNSTSGVLQVNINGTLYTANENGVVFLPTVEIPITLSDGTGVEYTLVGMSKSS